MMFNDFDNAMQLIASGKLEEAITALENMLLDDPKNADILYNLGMCFTDTNQPDKAVRVLRKSIEYNPGHSNSYVALGYAYSKLGDIEGAKKLFLDALNLDPSNSYAMRNLGGLFGKSGDTEKSLDYLKKAYELNPTDDNTIYGLGCAYQANKEYEKADTLYLLLLDTDASYKLKELARDGRREIAFINYKAKGLRMDAVMYMVSALRLYHEQSDTKIKEIAYEIAVKGRSGLDINNPDKKYSINSLPGEFTGLHLLCYMYVGFNKIAPQENLGMDLSAEYDLALKLFEEKEPA